MTDKGDAADLQRKFEDVLDWRPETSRFLTGKGDVSGLGHGQVVGHFNKKHVKAASKVVDLLVNKFDETHDLNAVLDYADNLQRNGEVNHYVLQWAVEIFIVHSDKAKESGMRYPEPKEMEPSFRKKALSFAKERKGEPKEWWMDYWRSDADVNFHHRHWHTVYIGQSVISKEANNWNGKWRKDQPQLMREGEVFAYMHNQMLARYNAERRSWGLDFTEPWNYTDRDPLGYDAGYEFNHSKVCEGYVPRPPGTWPSQMQVKFQWWTDNYKKACDKGKLPPARLTFEEGEQVLPVDYNMSGHVLEPASDYWMDEIGSIHNDGHDLFGVNLIDPEKVQKGNMSYMGSTITALRDPIFFRWHQHIDDLWQYWNNKQTIELADDPPPVLLRPCDIIMKKTSDPLEGFANFSLEDFHSDLMVTQLEEPKKRFERNNKLYHDPFFYHIRFRRTDKRLEDELNLTFRIFICPQDQMDNRKMWIEMDKFVYKLRREQRLAVIIRPDLHSSVIKRTPSEIEKNGFVEGDFIHKAKGFCECGWPYNMLLPRGTQKGEDWSLCVFVTDNNKDKIDVYSSCGSMSYCGASGQPYPDKKPMGYPFTAPATINGIKMRITEAFPKLRNTAFSSFKIQNKEESPPLSPHISLWSPWIQLNQNDGQNYLSSVDKNVTNFKPNDKTGRFRVLIRKELISQKIPSNKVIISFQGRGVGSRSYEVSNATLDQRDGDSLDIKPGRSIPITVKGESSFHVFHDSGATSDEITMQFNSVNFNTDDDLFVTFTLEKPGSYLENDPVNTWVIRDPEKEETAENWEPLRDVFCVGEIMMEDPNQNMNEEVCRFNSEHAGFCYFASPLSPHKTFWSSWNQIGQQEGKNNAKPKNKNETNFKFNNEDFNNDEYFNTRNDLFVTFTLHEPGSCLKNDTIA